MDKSLDTTLGYLIESPKNASRGRGRGAPRQRRGGRRPYGGRMMVGPGTRRVSQGSRRVNIQLPPFKTAKSFLRSKNIPWQHDLFEDSLAAVGLPGFENDTKLHVSNLDRGVNNDDIWDLFSVFGELKRYAIHYDKNREPNGSAEVVYTKRGDALAAMKHYNNVKLDHRPMKIEIMSSNSELPASVHINVIGGVNGTPTRRVITTQGGA